MIASLRGKFLARSDDNLIIDVNGVGYLVSSASSVLSNLSAPGSDVSLLIYTDVKENSIALYGFSSQLEREVFLLLKKVSGIGSKTALALISGVGAEDLLKAIGSGDTSALTSVSGVGKKMAERVLVELREQVGSFLPGVGASSPKSTAVSSGTPTSDTILALEKLGFNSDRARQAVNVAASRISSDTDAETLLREALSHLS